MVNPAVERCNRMDDDSALLSRCLEGDSAGWELLVRRYQRLVFAIVTRMGLSHETAEDVFQTVFARLYQNLEKIQDPSRLQAWITTTAKREALLQRRKEQREPSFTSHAKDGDAHPFEVEDSAVEAGDQLSVVQELDRVRQGIAQLDQRCRTLIELLFVEGGDGLSYDDIAKRLDIPIGSIGPTRARCLAKLRAALS